MGFTDDLADRMAFSTVGSQDSRPSRLQEIGDGTLWVAAELSGD